MRATMETRLEPVGAGRRHAGCPSECGAIARGSARGLTLVEVCIALALTAMMCAGLYGVGMKARRFAETDRVVVEARALAKERLEEMRYAGRQNLGSTSCTYIATSTNATTRGYPVVVRPRLTWHAADGSVTQFVEAVYVEVHVDAVYHSPLYGRQTTDTYSMVIAE